MAWFWITLAVIGGLTLFTLGRKWLQRQREAFINGYEFPPGLFDRLSRRRPGLTRQDCERVDKALRQYFRAYLKSGCKYVSMPSQLADDLWHEFILYTRNYQLFCRRAFGRFFHHTPAVALSRGRRASNAGLRRVWWHACKEEGINPRSPVRLPLLFGLDGQFKLEDGFFYAPDCKALQPGEGGGVNCGGDFSDSSFDGGTDGFDDSSSDGGDGDGGGDGGSGCGGGCGGGGD